MPVSETDGGDHGVSAKKVWRPRRLDKPHVLPHLQRHRKASGDPVAVPRGKCHKLINALFRLLLKMGTQCLPCLKGYLVLLEVWDT
ncbi:hypothetical protein HYDPIDRAFT_108015 [Hydnomerulius pinastri MD-312]|nr:hypothetical protein HYDPIDRAFT_108015 [Hydnomerulius pinastri MD-312]